VKTHGGADWQSALPARSTDLADSSLLRSRLLQLNSADIPMTIKPGQNPDELVVEWRYAEGRWIDHARLHAVRRVHRLVLRPDTDLRSVIVSQYMSRTDASIGPGGASLDWAFATGVTFFQRERQRVVGITLDEHLRPTGSLSHTWFFDTQEMIAPLDDRATHRHRYRFRLGMATGGMGCTTCPALVCDLIRPHTHRHECTRNQDDWHSSLAI